jgi:hypothetical protein
MLAGVRVAATVKFDSYDQLGKNLGKKWIKK